MTTPHRLSTPSVAYQGDGVTRTFPIPFDFVRAEDVKISVSPPVGFNAPPTIRGEGDPNGGTLDLAKPLPAGNVLTVYRDPPIGQGLDLAGEFHPPSLEAHLDRLVHVAQRLNGDVRLLTQGGTAYDGGGTVGAALRTFRNHDSFPPRIPDPSGKDGHLLGVRGQFNAAIGETFYDLVWLPPYSGEDEAGNEVILADGSVTTSKLADAAVTTAKLADGAVTPEKLAASVLTDAWSGDVDAGGHALLRPTLRAARERAAAIADSGGTLAVDPEAASIRHAVLSGDRTLTLTAAAGAGEVYQSVRLYLKQDTTGGRLVTWPSSIRWAGGAPPTLSTAAGLVDVVHLGTLDGGQTWEGFVAAQGLDGLGMPPDQVGG